MKRHLLYLKYVLRHKWFCFVGCWRISPILSRTFLLGIIHDWSKFRPSEWSPCATHFFSDGPDIFDIVKENFYFAFLHYHVQRNKHHWQHWVAICDSGVHKCFDMPDCYIMEMVADWYAAGRAISGRRLVTPWYEVNKDKILLSPMSRIKVEIAIKGLDHEETELQNRRAR